VDEKKEEEKKVVILCFFGIFILLWHKSALPFISETGIHPKNWFPRDFFVFFNPGKSSSLKHCACRWFEFLTLTVFSLTVTTNTPAVEYRE
jgi:hypothetical protein